MDEENEILKIIYKYYPKNKLTYTDSYYETVEFNRLKILLKNEEKQVVRWLNFIEFLRAKVFNNYKIVDWTQFFYYDAAYICRLDCSKVENEDIQLVINISVISNYFSIYQTTKERVGDLYMPSIIDRDFNKVPKELVKIVIDEIKGSFKEYRIFPKVLVDKVIPDVSVGLKSFGEATFFDCLFTSNVW